MSSADIARGAAAALRCDHCGRAVRGTCHTRTTYQVDYYRLHSGRGELCSVLGDFGRGLTYIRLLEQYDIITCAQCYGREEVQLLRERRFHPEMDAGEV
ncbi:MAG: hypothetical protein AB7V27_10350 [Candidatus Binatia bacterium]